MNNELRIVAGLLIAVALSGLTTESPARAAEDQKAESNPRTDAVPVHLQNWKIRFNGFAGTPGDRSWFRVSLGHDGMIKVEKRRRRGDYRTVLDEKLEVKEAEEFFRTAAKIINEYKRNKSQGDLQDGWELTLGLSAESFKEKSVEFYDHYPPGDKNGPAGFDVLAKIINRHMKGERFPK